MSLNVTNSLSTAYACCLQQPLTTLAVANPLDAATFYPLHRTLVGRLFNAWPRASLVEVAIFRKATPRPLGVSRIVARLAASCVMLA